MADTSEMVQQIIDSVNNLSNQMSSRDQPRSDLNTEVSRIFGRSRATTTATSSATENSTSQTHASNTNMSESGGTSRFRKLLNTRRIGGSTNTRSSRSRLPDISPLCDLVLLNGATTNIVPRQGARVILMEHGHVLSACRFTKGKTEIQVEATILEAFGDKIPRLVHVERD